MCIDISTVLYNGLRNLLNGITKFPSIWYTPDRYISKHDYKKGSCYDWPYIGALISWPCYCLSCTLLSWVMHLNHEFIHTALNNCQLVQHVSYMLQCIQILVHMFTGGEMHFVQGKKLLYHAFVIDILLSWHCTDPNIGQY